MPSGRVIPFPTTRGLQPQLDRLRSEVAALRAEHAHLSAEFTAGHLSREDMIRRQRRIADDVRVLTERMHGLIAPDAPQPPTPPPDRTEPARDDRDA